MDKILVYWNSASGKAEQIGALRDALLGFQTRWIDLPSVSGLVEAHEFEIIRGCETVVAAGGDGTVNAIVNRLMSVEVEERPSLAIIPYGTANDFAGTLCIPDDVCSASKLIERDAIPVDVVRIAGKNFERYFANVAAGGNCVRVSEAMTDDLKSRWGAFSYLRGAIDVLPNMTSYRVTAKCDDEAFTDLDSWAILVANGRTNAGRIEVAPQASPTDGLLDVLLIRDGTIGDMVEIVANNLLGSFLECEQVIFRQAKRLQLESSPAMRFTLDGEVIDEEPIQFDVVPGAIRMHTEIPVP